MHNDAQRLFLCFFQELVRTFQQRASAAISGSILCVSAPLRSQQAQLLFVRDWKNSDDEERVGRPTVEFLGRAEKEM